MPETDIQAFLLTRFAEQEAVALRLKKWADGDDFAVCLIDEVIGPFNGSIQHRNIGTGMDIASVADPDVLLRDVAAKRLLLDLHRLCCTGYGPCDETGVVVPCLTQRILAAAFEGTSGFNPAWRVEW